jgi:hypothetical protein
VTLVFAVLLAGLGVGGYFGTGSEHPTALIPAAFGIALGICGFLAISPDEGRRKLFMHINVTIGLAGFVGTIAQMFHSLTSAKELDTIALAAQLAMAWLLLIYVILCVRSFVVVRRSEVVVPALKKAAAPPPVVIASASKAVVPPPVAVAPPSEKE